MRESDCANVWRAADDTSSARLGRWRFWSALGLCCVTWCGNALATAEASAEERAREAYERARIGYRANSNQCQMAWQFGRACFDWAEFVDSDETRRALAEQGIEACEQAVSLDGNSAEAHYYLAFNLGQKARTLRLRALRLVRQMEDEFRRVLEIDAAFDYAGADRSLGILYRDAPGWPVSVGNREKAREHLTRAVKLAPTYPDNPLSLIEAHLEWKETDAALKIARQFAKVLPAARKAHPPDAWQDAWVGWNKRWAAIRERLGKGNL